MSSLQAKTKEEINNYSEEKASLLRLMMLRELGVPERQVNDVAIDLFYKTGRGQNTTFNYDPSVIRGNFKFSDNGQAKVVGFFLNVDTGILEVGEQRHLLKITGGKAELQGDLANGQPGSYDKFKDALIEVYNRDQDNPHTRLYVERANVENDASLVCFHGKTPGLLGPIGSDRLKVCARPAILTPEQIKALFRLPVKEEQQDDTTAYIPERSVFIDLPITRDPNPESYHHAGSTVFVNLNLPKLGKIANRTILARKSGQE